MISTTASLVMAIIAVIHALVTAFLAIVALPVAMSFVVVRHILALVPVVAHKIDALAAGPVAPAVLVPMLGMACAARADRAVDDGPAPAG